MAASSAVPLTGQQIATAAYASPSLGPKGLSMSIVIVSIIPAMVTLLVACLRVWVRLGLLHGLSRVWKTEAYLFASALVS